MWLVAITFTYGLKSVWIPWLWPVFNQIFLMVYLSAWLRRSNVTTGAEWIFFRFGKGKGGNWSHSIVVIFAIVSCLGFLAYGFIGLGKFVEIFIPWEMVAPYIPFDVPLSYVPHLYGIVFTLCAVFYSIVGGMSGIVWTDLLQFTIMTVSSIAIAFIAWTAMGTYTLNVPQGWMNPFFGWNLHLDWAGTITEVNEKIASDGYSIFGLFFMLMLFKGVLSSIAGPAPNYDMQKILSTRSPKEAAKMSGFVSLVLLPVRYLMIGGFVVLGILFYNQLDLTRNGIIDFEKILPSAISLFVPVGLMGLLLAGLLAAFMSTFAGTLNAAQAYLINDIYLRDPTGDGTGAESSVRTQEYSPAGWRNVIPSASFVDEFERPSKGDAKEDPRLHKSVYFIGDLFNNGNNILKEENVQGNKILFDGVEQKISWRKFSSMYNVDTGASYTGGINQRVLLYGEVLLNLAECELEAGNLPKAIEYLNMTRTRPSVDMPPYPTARFPVGNKDQIMAAIIHEKRVELGSLQVRDRDIIRWRAQGKLTSEPISYFTANKYERLPIPQSEIDNNASMTQADQNPGY